MIRFKNYQGFTLVEALLITLILSVVGLGGWYVFNENNKKDTSSSSSDTTNQNPTEINKDDAAYIVPELGIRFTLPADLKSLTHKYDSEYKMAEFYMPDLDKLADYCEDKGPMIINTWSKVDGKFNEDEAIGSGLIKQFEDYHIASTGGPSGRMCTDEKVRELDQKYSKALYEASKTVEAIN